MTSGAIGAVVASPVPAPAPATPTATAPPPLPADADANNSGAGGEVVERHSIPRSVVGRVIGKQGANINAVRQQTAASVDIRDDDDENGGGGSGGPSATATVTIRGSAEAVAAARAAIGQLLAAAQRLCPDVPMPRAASPSASLLTKTVSYPEKFHLARKYAAEGPPLPNLSDADRILLEALQQQAVRLSLRFRFRTSFLSFSLFSRSLARSSAASSNTRLTCHGREVSSLAVR